MLETQIPAEPFSHLLNTNLQDSLYQSGVHSARLLNSFILCTGPLPVQKYIKLSYIMKYHYWLSGEFAAIY
jgi:hypothetical protein